MRLAFMFRSGCTAVKYFSISKVMPSPLDRHTGWVFSLVLTLTSVTLSPRASLMKVKASL